MIKMEYNKIPNSLFKEVVKVRDIRKARVLSKDEKNALENGSPDISLSSPLGFTDIVPRDFFIKTYKYPDGNKIKLSGWKSKYSYIVTAEENTYAYAFQLPSTHTMEIVRDGKKIQANKKSRGKRPGDFIVCTSLKDGSIDRSKAFVINYMIFRKMFKVLKDTEVLEARPKHQVIVSSGKVAGKELIDKIIKNTPMDIITDIPDRANETQEKFKAIGKIERDKKTIGFILQDSLGNTVSIEKSQLMDLCRTKSISNIALSKTEEGKDYIHGVGMKISELPVHQA